MGTGECIGLSARARAGDVEHADPMLIDPGDRANGRNRIVVYGHVDDQNLSAEPARAANRGSCPRAGRAPAQYQRTVGGSHIALRAFDIAGAGCLAQRIAPGSRRPRHDAPVRTPTGTGRSGHQSSIELPSVDTCLAARNYALDHVLIA